MTLIPLSSLLIEGRPDSHPVASRRGELICFSRFRSDVMDAVARFKDHRSAALVCQDSYNFTVGFFGLLHAGANIVLPANSQPGSMQTLREEFDFLVDDVTIENGQEKIADLMPIDPTLFSLSFFTSGSTGASKKISKNLAMLEERLPRWMLCGAESGTGTCFRHGIAPTCLWPDIQIAMAAHGGPSFYSQNAHVVGKPLCGIDCRIPLL